MPGMAGPPLTPEQQWYEDHNVAPAGAGPGMAVNIPPYPGPPAPDTQGPADPSPPPPASTGAPPISMSSSEAPAPTKQPALQGLATVASGEKFSQEVNREGWDMEQPPNFAVPGGPALTPASRALAELVSQRGRAY